MGWQGARDLLTEMRKKGLLPNDVTYNALLRGYALQGYAYRGVRPCTTVAQAAPQLLFLCSLPALHLCCLHIVHSTTLCVPGIGE